jgi:hypothetical protein
MANIWIMSWNCEAVGHTSAQVVEMWNTAGGYGEQPDMIVVGMQEAAKVDGGFLTHQILKGISSGYSMICDLNIHGMTKFGQLFTGGCYQHLGIIVKNTFKSQVTNVHTDRNLKGKTSEKGSLDCTMDIGATKVCFVSTHLSANTPESRSKDLAKQLAFAAGTAATSAPSAIRDALAGRYGVTFLFGDLNYRLGSIEGRLGTAPKSITEITRGQMAAKMCTELGREQMWDLDTLNQSELADPKGFGFEFPKPAPLFMPTYKRIYDKPADKQACIQFATKPTELLACQVYIKGKGDKILEVNQKRREYDIGWLDRIGFLAHAPAHVTMTAFIDFPKIVVGDHVGVLMKLTI